MDPVNPPDAGRPGRVVRTLVVAVSAAIVTVALGVITAVLIFGPPGNGGSANPPPVTVAPTATPSGTTSPPVSTDPSPRVTVVIREPSVGSAETVLGAIASMGTLLAGVGTLLAAVAALRTTRAAQPASRQRKRSRKR